ncbi:MAG: 4Fe-4S dicluster domain-containing protein [Desulfurococcales archaeon]|nr:4Fe-4S dicluster domain-containing protein [Desulfurococcales archaeon]
MAGEIIIEHFAMVEDLEPIVYIVSTITVIVLLYSLWEAYKRWTFGGERIEYGPIGLRIKNLLKYAIFQWKVVRHRFPGLIHLLIYGGMLWLLIATSLRAIDLHVHRFLVGNIWIVYKLLNNIAGVMVVVGSILAMIRRALGLTPNLPKDPVYYIVHILFIIIVVTGFFLDGMSAAYYRQSYEKAWFDPVGYLIYKWATTLTLGELKSIYRPLWLFHFLIAQFSLAIIPFTNLWHIAAATLNVTLSRKEPAAMAIRAFHDIDERIEQEKPIGIVKLKDTTWKQRMDYDACTSCMRCTNACPAYASGKILSPRDIITRMRDLMYNGAWDENVWSEEDGETASVKINPEAVWSCVTCGACVNECPVLIHHVDTIIDVRRGMMSSGSEQIPEDALNALYSMQQTGNPFGYNPVDREEWIQELSERYGEDIIAEPGEEYDYLYWIGCVASYDPRIRPVAEQTIRLLKKAGYRVAVLMEEGCCGEPARRMGEEALFVEIMKMNLENLSQYKFKKLLVHCPHGYHVFKNEYKKYLDYIRNNEETKDYADFLEKLEVEHHSVVLARLLKEGKIKPEKEVEINVTFHDPCYLGRWNGHYDEPRSVLQSIKGLRIKEMPRSRDKSFCCGGGGGHMFYEIKRGQRIARLRAQEAAETLKSLGDGRPSVVAVACPYCNTMFRGEAEDFGFEVRDIAEILGEAVKESSGEESS